jgi:MFS family permease
MRMKRFLKSIIFGNEDTFDNPYRRSQDLFILEGAVANVMGVLTGGIFLVGYASWLGASDYIAGILLSLPLFTNFLQLLSALIYEKMERRKKFMITLIVMYRALICGIIFIPLILPKPLWIYGLMVMVTLGYGCMSIFSPGTSNWVVSVVPQRIRGRYFARRESVFQTTGMLASLIMGWIVDMLGKDYVAFAIVFGTALLFAALDVYFLTKIEEPPVQIHHKQRLKFSQLFVIPLQNKVYIRFVLYWMIWNFGLWMALPFFSVYMVNDLKLSYIFMTIQNTIQVITLVVAVRWWGRYGDTHSWDRALKLSCLVLCGAFALWILVTPGTVFLLIPLGVLSGIAFGGMNMSAFNAVFQLSPEKGRTVYLGFQAAFTGLAGFLGPVLGGKLGEWYGTLLQGWGITGWSSKQLLFLTATLIMLGAWVYAWRRVHIQDMEE